MAGRDFFRLREQAGTLYLDARTGAAGPWVILGSAMTPFLSDFRDVLFRSATVVTLDNINLP